MTTHENILELIREKFFHVNECPFSGERIFFENAGGSLTLKSVVETSNKFAAIPDNQGRDNPASKAIMEAINRAKNEAMEFFNVTSGRLVVGESGTELLFRLIRTAIMGSDKGEILGSTLEHPATRSASIKWSGKFFKSLKLIPHCSITGSIDEDRFLSAITSSVKVVTIVHTSPVTGIGVDLAKITKEVRGRSPEAYIIVDGIQHAPHGDINIGNYDIDGYVISPYKVFSRHGYGLAWISERLAGLPHDALVGGPELNWDLGTRDAASYATFSDVMNYFSWLGSNFSENKMC